MRKFLWILVLFSIPAFSQRYYSARFPVTENPLSQNSNWVNGATTGLDWGDVQVSSARASGTTVSGNPPYNDSTALVTGSWGNDQLACTTVSFDGTLSRNTAFYELEVRLRSTMTAHSSTGYEFLYSMKSDGNQYAQIVRWNGPLNNFTPLATRDSSNLPVPTALATGDILCGSAVGTTLTLYRNGTALMTATDATYASGNPGIGMYNFQGVSGDNTKYGLTTFFATDSFVKAASCSKTDITTAITNAATGGTVWLPPCNTNIGSNVNGDTAISVTKAVNILGSGQATTVLGDNNFKGNGSCTGGVPLFAFSPSVSTGYQLLEFTINGVATDPNICQPGHVTISGTSQNVRISDVTITNEQTAGFRLSGCVFGLADHFTQASVSHKQPFLVEQYTCGGGANDNGDYNWSQGPQFGSPNYWFIEDSTFNDTNAVGAGSFDGLSGMRTVFRFNTSSFIVGHGTESGQRRRGTRALEIYKNTFIAQQNSQFAGIYLRSGTALAWGNAFNTSGANFYQSTVSVINDRDSDGFPPWGFNNTAEACDGRGPYDNNGAVAFSGTVGTGGSGTFTASGSPGWTTNQWVGYGIIDTTAAFGSTIASNTANTVTVVSSAFGQGRTFTIGDSVQIVPVTACIDQVGRGQGTLLSGATPSPTGWPSQAQEPAYFWLNTKGGANDTATPTSYRILANRDSYGWNTSCVGGGACTSGVGTGTSFPTTCTNGTGFWRTDLGSWNKVGSSGQLYTCSSNSWNLYYAPYQYPHPLQVGTLTSGDITPPVVSLTAPAAGTVSGTVTVSATCTDNVGVAGVTFKYGTTNIGTEDTTAPYSVSWDTTLVANAPYSLTAVCRDTSNNSTTSTPVSVTVSNITTVTRTGMGAGHKINPGHQLH